MVRLAGELQRVSTFMSGTGFYFCHVINKRDAIVKLNMADTVTIDNISLPVRKYVKYVLFDTAKAREGKKTWRAIKKQRLATFRTFLSMLANG
jgi:predicted GTPase